MNNKQQFYIFGIPWTILSLDLMVPVFFLWEYLTDYVYRDRQHTHNARANACYSGQDCDHISRTVTQILFSCINCYNNVLQMKVATKMLS